MKRKPKFHNPKGIYFVSFAVVEWLDVFTRIKYKNILLDSLAYCQKQKGMEIFAWVIMTNHVHFVFRSIDEKEPGPLLGDFKQFTSNKIVQAIIQNPKESRKKWMLEQFLEAGRQSSNVKRYQFWRHDNWPIELWSKKVIDQKINYIHMNPVKQGIVEFPEDFLYSSARDYIGGTGLLGDVVVLKK